MFDYIMEFVMNGPYGLAQLYMEAFPEVTPVIITRVAEASIVVYVVLLVMIYLVVWSVFRAFFKRA